MMKLFIAALAFALVPFGLQAEELTDKQKRYYILQKTYLGYIQSPSVASTGDKATAPISDIANNILGYFYSCVAAYAWINEDKSAIPSSDTTRRNGFLLREHSSSFFGAVAKLSPDTTAKELAGEPVTKAVRDAKDLMSDPEKSTRQVQICDQFLNKLVFKFEAHAQQQVKDWQ